MSEGFAANVDDYKLKGLPLTPAGIQELIIELFTGKTVERHEVVTIVEKVHSERGGAVSRAADFPRSVKRALRDLKEAGFADNPIYGFWRFVSDPNLPTVTQSSISTMLEPEPLPVVELTLGQGKSSVYLYYFPTYSRDALANGRSTWACKIGRSDRDPVNRIVSQAGTAMPEVPVIGLMLQTDLPSQWEHVLHGILALRGKIVEEAPGAEWFNTSPQEVREIIQYIDPAITPINAFVAHGAKD